MTENGVNLLKQDTQLILLKALCLQHIGPIKLNGKNKMINTKMSAEERKQLAGLIKPRQDNKLINPQEKIGDKIPKNFPIRGEQSKLF